MGLLDRGDRPLGHRSLATKVEIALVVQRQKLLTIVVKGYRVAWRLDHGRFLI